MNEGSKLIGLSNYSTALQHLFVSKYVSKYLIFG